MRENKLRTLWLQDAFAVNGWLSLPATFSAEVMAHEAWDSLTIDLQHGLIDYQIAVGMLQAISTTPTVPLVRVPWLDPAIIMKVLDAGAYGVICPMINSAAEAAEFVAACRYPPSGTRSCGPIRASIYGGSDYIANANRTIVAMAMIETRSALDNLDEILSVPGLDAVYVGPSDLSLALGREPRLDPTDAVVIETIEEIATRAHKKKVVPGIHTASPAGAQKMVERGFRFVTIGSDVRLMVAKASEVLQAIGRRTPPEIKADSTKSGPY
jgi:4-hydroxy-2-oxoheptanedioate aldolase